MCRVGVAAAFPERCYYGHLHGGSHRLAVEGKYGEVEYHLVAADYVGFQPQKICE